METKKLYLMDQVIDLSMTKLFQLAEYVCNRCSSVMAEPATAQEVVPTIRFTSEDKATIKPVVNDACIRPTISSVQSKTSFKRKPSRLKHKVVEGDLFG